MQENINRQVYLNSRPAEIPQAENFSLRETEVPRLEEGEILISKPLPLCRSRDARVDQ